MQNTIRSIGKMTLTFSPDKYGELLMRYRPKLIKTEEENEQALTVVEKLMHRQNRTPEEEALYELLIALIEKFEQEFYRPGSASTPDSMLLFLMEQQGVSWEDLAVVMGSEEIVAEMVNGSRDISQQEARILGDFFQVDFSLFVGEKRG